jgi:hypothetical protein
VAASGNRIYCVGGWDGGTIDEIVVLSVVDDSVELEKKELLPVGETDSALVAADPYLYLIGGRDPRIRRLLKCQRIEMDNLVAQPVTLRSYAW